LFTNTAANATGATGSSTKFTDFSQFGNLCVYANIVENVTRDTRNVGGLHTIP
jgi:hypothetical protein